MGEEEAGRRRDNLRQELLILEDLRRAKHRLDELYARLSRTFDRKHLQAYEDIDYELDQDNSAQDQSDGA